MTSCVLARRFDTLLDRLVADLLEVKRSQPLRPVGVVVPGSALRRHVRDRLGSVGPLLGVEVLTLNGLAMRALDQDDEAVCSEVHQLLISQLPRPDGLETIERADGLLHAVFRDLHDAGFGPEHLDAALELLADEPWLPRGTSLLKAFAAWRHAASLHGLTDRSDLVRQATERLSAGGGLWPGGPTFLFWYGLYDLTGVMADLVSVLCRCIEGRMYFLGFDNSATRLPVPATPDQYLREVFESVIAPVTTEKIVVADAPRTPIVRQLHASGERGELAAVARAIAHWADGFDDDPPWSSVAVIVRDLSAYHVAGQRVFARHHIPIVCPKSPPARLRGRVRGLLAIADLVRDGLRRDRLLDAIVGGGPTARDGYRDLLAPLDAALRRLGVNGEGDWPPLLSHLAHGRGLPGLPDPVAAHFADHLEAVRAALNDWPSTAPAAEHAARWRDLVRAVLRDDDSAPDSVVGLADEAAAALEPTPGRVTKAAFVQALSRRLEAATTEDTTRDGVLFADVMSARGMTFDRVFLVGLNRRRWPRPIDDDALIPDRIRRRLRTDLGLDALPVKERGHAEEALLFRIAADGAAEELVLCHQRSDEAGKALVASPFVEQLEDRISEVRAVPRRRMDVIGPLVAAGNGAALTTADLAFYAAVRRRLDARPSLLSLSRADKVRSVLMAAGLDAMRHRDDVTGRLNAHDGLVGPRPIERALAPTRVESLLRCPWQAYVRDVLSVEPPKVVRDIPPIDFLRRGTVLHAVHERLVAWLQGVEPPGDLLTWADADALARNLARNELRQSLVDEPIMASLIEAVQWPGIETRIEGLVQILRDAMVAGRTPIEAEHTLSGTLMVDGREVRLTGSTGAATGTNSRT